MVLGFTTRSRGSLPARPGFLISTESSAASPRCLRDTCGWPQGGSLASYTCVFLRTQKGSCRSPSVVTAPAGDAPPVGLRPTPPLIVHRDRARGRFSGDTEISHWITSSANASRRGRTSMPSDLAVLRLITNSTLVGCRTGRSAGFMPLRTLPT